MDGPKKTLYFVEDVKPWKVCKITPLPQDLPPEKTTIVDTAWKAAVMGKFRH